MPEVPEVPEVPEQEVVLVTGARKGIGRFLAEHFMARGARVEGCSRQAPDWAPDTDTYHHHIVDVSDEAAVTEMMASIYRRHGRLDVTINSAGIASMNHIMLTPITTIDRIMATNVRGALLVCRESAKVMMKRRYGRIINISTVGIPLLLEGEAVYAASKSALTTLTQIMAREFAPFGITCNVVAPGPLLTDMNRGVPRDKIDQVVDRLAIKRPGTLDDVANVVDFFARRESEYVTGQVLYLGGIS